MASRSPASNLQPKSKKWTKSYLFRYNAVSATNTDLEERLRANSADDSHLYSFAQASHHFLSSLNFMKIIHDDGTQNVYQPDFIIDRSFGLWTHNCRKTETEVSTLYVIDFLFPAVLNCNSLLNMDVGELFCQGHQSQFQDRQRPETVTKIQLFSYLT